MRDMRGRSRFRQLSITFSFSRNAIGQSLLWKFAGELLWKKKWRPQVREKWDAVVASLHQKLFLVERSDNWKYVEHGKHCFGIMISIDTGEFSNSLGCYVGFYEADLVGNSVLPYSYY